MAASLRQIREGLKARIETIPSLSGRVYQFIPGTQEPPSVVIVPGTFIPGDTKAAITYDQTMARGSHDYVFTLQVIVSRVAEDAAATQLDSYLSTDTADSIKVAIESDGTLGGLVSFCNVNRVIQYGALIFNDVSFFGGQIIVEVTA